MSMRSREYVTNTKSSVLSPPLPFIHSSLIVLYAIPLDASNIDRTPSQLANDIFGINETETQDPVNAKSQVLRCSRGQLNYIPACGTPEQSCYSTPLVVNGVLRVPINYNVTGIASGTVKNWVEAEAQSECSCVNHYLSPFIHVCYTFGCESYENFESISHLPSLPSITCRNSPIPNPTHRSLQLQSDHARHSRRSRLGRSGGLGLPPRSDVCLSKFLFLSDGGPSSRVRA